MSREQLERHRQKLQSVSRGWEGVIETVKNKIRNESNQRRTQLKERLNKLRADEQELKSNYQTNGMLLSQELSRVSTQIDSIDSQTPSAPTFDVNADIQRKAQMEQIFTETHKEMTIVLDRHREKVKRVDDILARKTSDEKRLTASIPVVVNTPINNIIDDKKKNLSEALKKLEEIREEIQKKIKELVEISRKEAEDINESEQKCIQEETKQRREEMQKTIQRIKDSLKK